MNTISMVVSLNSYTDPSVAVRAGLMCTMSEDNVTKYLQDGGLSFLSKLKFSGHLSVFEHISCSWEVKNISRALLQELARHRHTTQSEQALSVQSSRWALQKVKALPAIPFYCPPVEKDEQTGELVVLCNKVDELLKLIKASTLPNDVLKYFLPEGVKTSLTISMNLREFIAMYSLRSQPNVLDEFRLLVFEMRRVLPLVLQELV